MSSLSEESENLKRSWMRHDSAWLRDYLVASVEDPRVNLQSIFSRHFLLRAIVGDQFAELMEHEYRFSAAMNWLVPLASAATAHDDFPLLLRALQQQADNVEGTEIPRFLLKVFASLPTQVNGITIPNYIETFLCRASVENGGPKLCPASLNTFLSLWKQVLAPDSISTAAISLPAPRIKVLEVACGSANDYRFLFASGISQLLDYTGIDLCDKNIENACILFPHARFEVGNVFEIGAADRAFDLCFFHDLLEHLSLAGLEAAVREICRVTRHSICAGFFQLDEIPEHVVRPLDDYHINTLSLDKVKDLFAANGFFATVLHVGAFLRQQVGCEQTHNPNAYTLILRSGLTE